jgi:hypothetical protein
VLSRRHVEIGLVPLGAIGMTVFSVDLYFASRGCRRGRRMGAGQFLAQPAHWRVLADLALLSLFAGIYSVPMYALIQMRSQPTHRARIIAANNILNALFMIASSVMAGALLKAGFTCRSCSWSLGCSTPWSRPTSSCWCRSTCCASWPGCLAPDLPLQGARRRAHPPRARRCWCATT